MPQVPEDTIGSLEEARERLYAPGAQRPARRASFRAPDERATPHAWKDKLLPSPSASRGARHVHFAGLFLIAAVFFFLVALAAALYFFYFGGNAVSVNKVNIDIQGPTTIAAGDAVPLMVTITNGNAVALDNATLEMDFPSGTKSGTSTPVSYPRYSADLGSIASGATVTRSVRVYLFGTPRGTVTIPASLSFGVSASNSTFVKKSSYDIAISSTPLSVSVDAPTSIMSGKPLSLVLTVRSNATVPIDNVVLTGAFPFGFSVASSSIPLQGSSMLIGTLSAGEEKVITLSGTLVGQDNDTRTFHFTVGTATDANDPTISTAYLTQDATISIASPFLSTQIAFNGNSSDSVVLAPGSIQNVSISYTNTLPVSLTNASIAVTISGSGVDYGNISATRGFYQSANHTITFSRDTDASLASLAPGASGTENLTFSTLAASADVTSPTVTFTIATAGMPSGQTSSTAGMSATVAKTYKVATAVVLSAVSLHTTGPFPNDGPIPPQANTETMYTISLSAHDTGSAVAGGTVSLILPSYVTYTGNATDGITYNDGSRTVTWNVGDLAQGASATGAFQISFTPSTSQRGGAPVIANSSSFSGYDRFSGANISASADAVTTATADPGVSAADALVQ